MSQSPIDYSANIERFSGFADLYDRFRPDPPAILASVLTRLANIDIPDLVVDLGSGTGLSTRYWTEKAKTVIGIEPTSDMRAQAIALTPPGRVTYREGYSHQTGLSDACAQIVTCSQSLHWMEPQSTFIEAARILQSRGVFAAFDYDWPPATGKWEADLAFQEFMLRSTELANSLNSAQGVMRWDKARHLARMQESGCFRYTREILLHHVDLGNAERLVGLALSQGGVMSMIKQGIREADLGLDDLRETAASVLGADPRQWVWSSRVRIGIK
jgi:ubiquinone/menaquinone biosynthesis C-methylase UbiE